MTNDMRQMVEQVANRLAECRPSMAAYTTPAAADAVLVEAARLLRQQVERAEKAEADVETLRKQVWALETDVANLEGWKMKAEAAIEERDTFKAAWEASADVAKKAVEDMAAERIKRKDAEAKLTAPPAPSGWQPEVLADRILQKITGYLRSAESNAVRVRREIVEALQPPPSGWQQRIAAMETAYVVGFLFSRFEEDDVRRVVLVLKARPSWQAGRFNGVGGKIEPGESPLDAMRREFCEETGRFIEAWEPFVVLGGDGWRVHFFRAFTDIPLDSDFATVKTDEPIVCVKVSQIASVNTLYNLRWLIPMALDGDVVAGKDRPEPWQNAVDAGQPAKDAIPPAPPAATTCARCKWSGDDHRYDRCPECGDALPTSTVQACGACHGTGLVVALPPAPEASVYVGHPCEACKGTGLVMAAPEASPAPQAVPVCVCGASMEYDAYSNGTEMFSCPRCRAVVFIGEDAGQPAKDAVTADVDATLDPVKRELVNIGHKLAKERPQ